jgi:hypothetical protein
VSSVWIEIARDTVSSHVISPSALLARWKAESAYSHTIMPMIEAAHIGPIPVTSFKRVFLVNKDDSQINEIILKGKNLDPHLI